MKVGKPKPNVATLPCIEVACTTEGCVLMACNRIVYLVGKAAKGVHCNAEMSEDYNELQSNKNGICGIYGIYGICGIY